MKLKLLHNKALCLFYNKNRHWKTFDLGMSDYSKSFYIYSKNQHIELGITGVVKIKLEKL